MGIDIVDGYPVEMHKVYVAWFLWGFWLQIALIAISIICFVLYRVKESASKVFGIVSFSLYWITTFVWLACGGIWRFSKAGIVASGDKLERMYGSTDAQWNQSLEAAQATNGYQVNSGRFMKIYLMLMAWIIILFILMSMVTFLTMCCCDPRAQKGHGLEQEKRLAAAGARRNQDAQKHMDYGFIHQDDENDNRQ